MFDKKPTIFDAEQVLREQFGDNPTIVIDMVKRDAEGNPTYAIFNKQYITRGGKDEKFFLMIMEFNRTTIGEITTRKITSIKG